MDICNDITTQLLIKNTIHNVQNLHNIILQYLLGLLLLTIIIMYTLYIILYNLSSTKDIQKQILITLNNMRFEGEGYEVEPSPFGQEREQGEPEDTQNPSNLDEEHKDD